MESKSRQLKLPLAVFFLLSILMFSSLALAQCEPGVTVCASDADCQAECPACYICGELGTCVADDTICQSEEGVCRQGTCENPEDPLLGCNFESGALNGVLGLEDICYIGAPPAVEGVNTCGNGICDEEVGENCQTCPADCLVPGFPGSCPSETDADAQCEIPTTPCTNGEVCDQGICLTIEDCQITDRVCSGDTSDLCCAAGCQGAPDGLNCAEAEAQGVVPAGECDVDCWPTPECGDGLVENPETCEQTAALAPGGVPVAESLCRLPGALAECTFCGDGIVQAVAGEECDGESDAACGGLSCSTSCTCEGLCISGSGNPVDTIRNGCGDCSLNSHISSQGFFKDYTIFYILVVSLVFAKLLGALRKV